MSPAVIPTPPDPFEEWFRQPIQELPPDSRFVVRRARPEEYERVYDVVDAAFGRKRPRAVYDWLYRQNPTGLARVWLQLERSSDELLKVGAGFPWPIWRNREVLTGSVGGDAATIPAWQRKGLNHIRRPVRDSHPWYNDLCGISGPNANSRAVAKTLGRSDHVLGRLRGGIALLRASPVLHRIGLPEVLSSRLGAASDTLFSAWRARGEGRRSASKGHIEEVRRFSIDFDDVTLRHMSWPMYWCPHNADFLNWRYLDHPGESYVGLVLLEDDRPEAYAVVRLDGQGAHLAELVASTRSNEHATMLLDRVTQIAIEAGCSYLNFFATPSFRHWGTLRRSGFLPYRSQNFFEVAGPRYEPEILKMKHWQAGPGDRDYH